MITCTVRYQIDPDKLAEFEADATAWLHMVPRMGGTHHGFRMPHQGPNGIACGHVSFPGLADDEAYRARMWDDPECLRAYDVARRTGCIRRYDRSRGHAVFDGAGPDALGP